MVQNGPKWPLLVSILFGVEISSDAHESHVFNPSSVCGGVMRGYLYYLINDQWITAEFFFTLLKGSGSDLPDAG